MMVESIYGIIHSKGFKRKADASIMKETVGFPQSKRVSVREWTSLNQSDLVFDFYIEIFFLTKEDLKM